MNKYLFSLVLLVAMGCKDNEVDTTIRKAPMSWEDRVKTGCDSIELIERGGKILLVSLMNRNNLDTGDKKRDQYKIGFFGLYFKYAQYREMSNMRIVQRKDTTFIHFADSGKIITHCDSMTYILSK